MRSRTRSRRNGARTRSRAGCGPRRPRWCRSSSNGGKLADEAAAAGSKVETASGFRRDAALPGLPASAITAAFRTAKDAAGQAAGAGGNEWIVFRVTDISVPPVDLASDDIKKLKETLQRSLTDEQVAQYVSKIEARIGTTINQAAFAQVTGANN